MNVGILIKTERLKANITQKDLVKKIKEGGGSLNQSQLSKIEKGKIIPRTSTFFLILEALDKTIKLV